MLSRVGVVSKTCVAMASRQASRNMCHHGHHPKIPTMNDLPVPSGSWQQAHSSKQTKYNMILLASIVFFASTITYLSQASDAGHAPSFKEGTYGVPDPMINKFSSVRSDAIAKHPLEVSENKYFQSQKNFDMTMMKRTQGIHAPLRLVMERNAASKIQRLPFLPSSNIMMDTLTGKDETIGFDNIFSDVETSDTMMHPHLVMEKSLGFI